MGALPKLVQVSPEAPKSISTVADVIDAYMAEKRNPFAERICKTPDSIAAHFVAIRAVWGTMPVEEFAKGSKNRVKLQVEEWRRIGWEVGTCRKRISQLRTAFKYCVDEELLSPALMPTFKLPPQGPPRERVLSPEEIAALLHAADMPDTPAHIRLCLHLSLRTGQRQGAIRDLTWPLVDFENRVIRFRDTEKASERSKKKRTDMPLDAVLYEMLMEAKENADGPYVIEWQGRRVANCYHAMKALYERAGVKDAHRHDLRRTAATLAYRTGGGDMKMAANFIGDIEATTAKHYAHATAADRLKPVEAISAFLGDMRKRA